MELPKFLLEMSKQLNEQDNRCTADPIWVVCYDEWLTCANDRGDKEVIIICDESGGCKQFDCVDEVTEWLSENYPDWCKSQCKEEEVESIDDIFDESTMDWFTMPKGVELEKIEMQKVVHKLKYCLTESDANAFIKRKQHDYTRLYTYVESMYHCPQMTELRNWIKGLANG